MEWSEEELMALAEDIGKRIEKGQLPSQDENGFYILPGDPRYTN